MIPGTTVNDAPPPGPRQSSRVAIPSKAAAETAASLEREKDAREMGLEWAKDSRRPKAHLVDTDGFLQSLNLHVAFMQSQQDPDLPRNYKEAMLRPEVWKPAMDEEMETMRNRGVWEVINPPPGANILVTM